MFPDFIESRAVSIPDRSAVWFGDSWFTYAQIDRRASRLADRLHALGVRRGDRVAILAPNHIAHIDLTLAATKLGFVHLPLNYRLGADELRGLLKRMEPSFLLVDSPHGALAAGLGCASLDLSGYETWLADAEQLPRHPRADLGPDDLHMILFTGGSTGRPKGACLPYRQTFGNTADTVREWGLQADDRVIQCTPCFHAAVNVLCLPLLLAGGSIVLIPRFEPAEYLALATTHRVTRLFMVPTMFRMLAEHPDFAGTELPWLRSAISGGAPCPPGLREIYARRGIDLRQGYGMTEAGVNCFRITADEAARVPGSVGRPMPGMNLVLRDPDGSAITEAGRIGEITMSGAQVCAGYFDADNADDAAQGFRNDGCFWSGDLASFDEDGLYTIRGRRKDLYISGGENIHPVEVEAALGACEGIAECVVFGWPHPRWGECGVALVVPKQGAAIDMDRLRADLQGRLARYKIPADFLLVAELPRTAAGKIDKQQALALYAAARPVSSPAIDLSTAA